MNSLSPQQAQALYEAGGFLLLTNLPEGSEFGIDGTLHIIRRFSGIKLLPPGLHLITWSPPISSSTTAGPSNIPIRSGLLRFFAPKQRVLLTYDAILEDIGPEVEGVISDDHLKGIDGELAPYPFAGLEMWKGLTSHITPMELESVVGKDGRVDGMMSVLGEEEVEDTRPTGPGTVLRFPQFRLKKSWRDGAFGEEVTKFSRDKSWLLANVVKEQLAGDTKRLIAHLQLSFLFLLHLSSYASLIVYKRFFSLLCRSSSILVNTNESFPGQQDAIRQTYTFLITTLTHQLRALPPTVFEGELPEMDMFYIEEIETLRDSLRLALLRWSEREKGEMEKAWVELVGVAKRSWNWSLGSLDANVDIGEDEEEDEAGEYAPQVVEI